MDADNSHTELKARETTYTDTDRSALLQIFAKGNFKKSKVPGIFLLPSQGKGKSKDIVEADVQYFYHTWGY